MRSGDAGRLSIEPFLKTSAPHCGFPCGSSLLPAKGCESPGRCCSRHWRRWQARPQAAAPSQGSQTVVFHKITTAPLPPPKGAAPRGDAVPMGASQPHAWEREPELGDTPKFQSCPPCSLGCDSLLPGTPLSICFSFHGGEMLWNRVKPWAGQQRPAPRSFFCGQAKDIAYGKQ